MYEHEIQKQRLAIIKGITASYKRMLSEKIKKNGLIAISKGEHVQVLRAQDVSLY
jgi:hypothetical protein